MGASATEQTPILPTSATKQVQDDNDIADDRPKSMSVSRTVYLAPHWAQGERLEDITHYMEEITAPGGMQKTAIWSHEESSAGIEIFA